MMTKHLRSYTSGTSDKPLLGLTIGEMFDQIVEQYPDNEVPVSVMAKDLLSTYKYGWKTSYYQNTNDMKSDIVEDNIARAIDLQSLIDEIEQSEEDCESCKI